VRHWPVDGVPTENTHSSIRFEPSVRVWGTAFGVHGWNVAVTTGADGGARFEFIGVGRAAE